jgi:FlaA1/EpsC-like NDP-sugar epimerase
MSDSETSVKVDEKLLEFKKQQSTDTDLYFNMIGNNNKVFDKISKAFPLINTGFSFKNLGYLPRWLVLSIDFIIVFVSIIGTYFLLLGLKLEYIPKTDLGYGIALWLCVNVILFWVFRTYSGIIRHSSFIDAIKLFLSQFSTFAVILVFNFICILSGEQKLFLTSGAFINTVLSFSVLFFYRIIVKQLFDNFNNIPESLSLYDTEKIKLPLMIHEHYYNHIIDRYKKESDKLPIIKEISENPKNINISKYKKQIIK